MKKTLVYMAFVLIVTGLCLNYSEELVVFYYDTVRYFSSENTKLTKNDYYRDYDFMFVQNTSDYEPNNAQDITNIFYTVINSGQNSFTFYCPRDYDDCLNDVKALASNQTKLSHINNYVHPYNGFKHIEIQYTSNGEVNINVTRSYESSDIEVINDKIDELYNSLVNENNTDIENIRTVHDYIINNSKYDEARSDYNILTYKSDISYGPLLQGYGICGGYSDAMALFLEKMGIKNFKVSSDSHVWNAVYLDGSWYHLDLTWDDPITSNHTDVLQHEYFLLTSKQLESKEIDEHSFDKNIYLEFKE